MMQHVDGARRRRRRAARVDAAGRAGPLRPPGLADGRGPHRPAYGRQRPHRRLPDRRVGRRVPRLPRRRPAGRQGVGQEQLAARVQLAIGDEVKAQGLVKAKWSDDSELTTRIDQQVAHYTGQTELAQAIQEGLAAKAAGDEETATTKLGRAVQLAAETGNEEATVQAAQGRRRRGRGRRHRPAEEDRREGRRDGARHRLHQDHAGRASDDLPQRPRVRGHRLLRHLRRRHGRRRETPSPQPGDTVPVPVLDPDAPAEAATPADGQECPNCGSRQRRRTPCSARRAATTSPPARCPAPGRRPQPRHRDRPRAAEPATSRRPLDDTVGGRALDRPALVRRAGQPRPAARRPARPTVVAAAQHLAARRPRLEVAATSTPTSTAAPTTASAAGTPS